MSKKIEDARRIFAEHIELAKTDGKRFRKVVLAEMVGQIGVSTNSAASMYNVCKKEAEASGLLAQGQIGRTPKADTVDAAIAAAQNKIMGEILDLCDRSDPGIGPAAAKADIQEPAEKPGDTAWAHVNGTDVNYYVSRTSAREARQAAGAVGRVMKADEVENYLAQTAKTSQASA